MAAFVVSSCNGTKVFETVNGALNDVASFVSLGVESWWRAATVAFAQPVFLRVQTLRADIAHTALLDLLSIMSCAISTVHTQARWPVSR